MVGRARVGRRRRSGRSEAGQNTSLAAGHWRNWRDADAHEFFSNVQKRRPNITAAGYCRGERSSCFWRSSGGEDAFEAIEQPLEIRLKDILEKIVGVGSVDVLVTVDSTEETVVVRDDKESQQVTDESDKNGGKRHVTSITKDGQVVLYDTSNDQSPIIQKRIKPMIRGVLIVAKGAENQTVRRLIMDAVEKGINVPVNRISVVPKKHQ